MSSPVATSPASASPNTIANAPLRIDPTIGSAAYLGGYGDDSLIFSAPGANPGSFAVQTLNGLGDAFLLRFDILHTPNRYQPTALQFLGGSGTDRINTLTAFPDNRLFLAGTTSSRDLPVLNALQPTYGGGNRDGFVVQFNPDGTRFQSTYLGGSGDDSIANITIATDLTLSVVGTTTSPDLAGLPSNPLIGNSDGFVIRLATLGDSGTVTLTASAADYFPATQAVSLVPLGVRFTAASLNLTTATVIRQLVVPGKVDPNSSAAIIGPAVLRPGINLTASATAADPSIVDVKPSTLSFTDIFSIPTLTLKALKSGTIVVNIGPMSNGGFAPASQSHPVTVK